MAIDPSIRRIPRDKLFAVFKTPELVKLVEDVLYGVGESLPQNTATAQSTAATAQSTATAAQGTADQAVLDAAAALATAELRLLAADMVGAVQWFAKSAPPNARWLVCDGTVYNIADHPELGAYLGSQWGGDGVTTFGVPELRGEFVRAWDNGRGVDPARVFGSAQADELKSHTHTVAATSVTTTPGGVAATAAGAAWTAGAAPVINATGGTETRPRNVALLPCIHV